MMKKTAFFLALLFSLLLASSVVSAVAESVPYVYWKLNETSGIIF